jgi:hypothetical protein
MGSDYIPEIIENFPENSGMVLENPMFNFYNKFSSITFLVLFMTVHANNA